MRHFYDDFFIPQINTFIVIVNLWNRTKGLYLYHYHFHNNTLLMCHIFYLITG